MKGSGLVKGPGIWSTRGKGPKNKRKAKERKAKQQEQLRAMQRAQEELEREAKYKPVYDNQYPDYY